MSLLEYYRRRARQIAIAVNGLFCVALVWINITYGNSTPQPDQHAQLGVVVIDLERLGYSLKYADLQSAGMFTGTSCSKCDFSLGGRSQLLSVDDLADHRFMSSLFMEQGKRFLWLHFYGVDIPAGQQRLDQALQVLRARFPGRGNAIKLQARGFGDHE